MVLKTGDAIDKKSILSPSIYYKYYNFKNKALKSLIVLRIARPLWTQMGYFHALIEKKTLADNIVQAAVPDYPYT